MAASSSGSCKSLTSKYVKVDEIVSTDRQPRSSKDAELCACDTFCHAVQERITQHERRQLANHGRGGSVTSSSPTRKAEREKLRRDRMNEQIVELAGALGELDRPKSDKSTILGDVIQVLKELMADIERLRAEHALLVDESQDLCQEKEELHEERAQLTSMVQHLQSQVYQHMHAMLLWMTTDPASMMGAYLPNSAAQGAIEVDTHSRKQVGPFQMQLPFLGPQSMPYPTAVHPALQAQYGYSGRGAACFPFPFNYTDGAPGHAELPYVPVPQGYPLQAHLSPLMHLMQPVSQAALSSQDFGSHYLSMTSVMTENQNVNYAGIMSGPSTGHNELYPASSSLKPCTNEHLANAQ